MARVKRVVSTVGDQAAAAAGVIGDTFTSVASDMRDRVEKAF
jgi:hypothetical protein